MTDECYPFTSQESQPAAQPCMMHSRSTGRGKRQATARCPNPQSHGNEIYQSTPAYRLAPSVSTCGAGVVLPAKAKLGIKEGGGKIAGEGCNAGVGCGAASAGGRGGVVSPCWVSPGCCGSEGGEPSPWYQLFLYLQEKEIMKELMENGPVQGRELRGALHCKSGICALGCIELRGSWGGQVLLEQLRTCPPPTAA